MMKTIIRFTQIAALLLIVLIGCTKKQPKLSELVQEGDIVFQNLEKSPDQNIWTALNNKYNQIGIIIKRNKAWQVYMVDSSVKYIPLDEYIARGIKGQYRIMRMLNSYGMIDKSMSYEISYAAKRYHNREYDYKLEIDNQRVYEPEIVWKLYREAFVTELGKVQTMSKLDLSGPDAKKYVAKHFNGRIPLKQEIITMDQILFCDFLEVVAEK